MLRQPRTVLSIAFACVIAFMGIGLVDPILVPIADELGATPSQVSLLFTSYMAVMGVAMLATGWVSSRLGAKRTLLLGLAVIIAGAGLAGSMDTITGIVAFRAVWGFGNALFIATALAAIVASARGSVEQAIILYESALGVGIAAGPLLGGALGAISWRWPFYGVSVLMAVALAATALTLPRTPPAGRPTSLAAPLRALRHRGLLIVGVTALLYNFGFFTLLAFTPFPLRLDAHGVGLVFFGWGLALAVSSVWVAPRLQRRIGTRWGTSGALAVFAVLLAIMAAEAQSRTVLIVCTIAAGAAIGINNTLITETVMKIAPVERGVASAAYSFVRFTGGAVAPWLATRLGEESIHLPFVVGSVAIVLAILVLGVARSAIRQLDARAQHGSEPAGPELNAAAVTTGDA